MATIENLCPELLVKIFSHYVRSEGHEAFLRNIPRVCKAWNNVTSEAPFWSDVTVRNSDFLLNLSRRELLRHTQSLELECDFEENFLNVNLSAVLKNIRDLRALNFAGNEVGGHAVTFVTENCPHLEILRLCIEDDGKVTLHEWDQFLTVCGPTLKKLDLSYHCPDEEGQQLLSGIAAKCPLLERLSFYLGDAKFPIYELRNGCPKLRELEFAGAHLITAGREDSLGCGFKELRMFEASYGKFNGLDMYDLMKNSINLERLRLFEIDGLVFGSLMKVPSDKVRILNIELKDPDENKLKMFGDAVLRWRLTLSLLVLRYWKCDVKYVLERLLEDNPNPQLETLYIDEYIDPRFFEEFIQKCKNLTRLNINLNDYKIPEEIDKALEYLKKMQERLSLGF